MEPTRLRDLCYSGLEVIKPVNSFKSDHSTGRSAAKTKIKTMTENLFCQRLWRITSGRSVNQLIKNMSPYHGFVCVKRGMDWNGSWHFVLAADTLRRCLGHCCWKSLTNVTSVYAQWILCALVYQRWSVNIISACAVIVFLGSTEGQYIPCIGRTRFRAGGWSFQGLKHTASVWKLMLNSNVMAALIHRQCLLNFRTRHHSSIRLYGSSQIQRKVCSLFRSHIVFPAVSLKVSK